MRFQTAPTIWVFYLVCLLESECAMNEPSNRRPGRPAEWCKVGELLLRNQAGCEEQAAGELQQALSQLRLPLSLLPKLQESVYNAVTRVCAARAGGDLLLLLFIAAQAVAPETHLDGAAQERQLASAAAEPGWGFFLIERRALSPDGGDKARAFVELYCYQEGL
jgi:hypothetical protein